MYILAASTGYRRGEIGSLTRESFSLDQEPPTVTVCATYSKHRQTDAQVLPPDLVTYLMAWLKSKKPRAEEVLFPVSKRAGGLDRRTSEMMQKDLARARAAWIKEAEQDPAERERREQSDFLAYRDREGRYADFHATRHTFITNLSRAGVSPKTAQKLARHSDIRLTMNVYSHTDLAEKEDAVKRLPAVWRRSSAPGAKEPKSALPDSATESWECIGSAPVSQPDKNGHSVSVSGTRNENGDDSESSPQCEEGTVVNASCRSSSLSVATTPEATLFVKTLVRP